MNFLYKGIVLHGKGEGVLIIGFKNDWIVVVSPSWLQLFPGSRLQCLIVGTSDHAPILLSTIITQTRRCRRRFLMENVWLRDAEFHSLVTGSWTSSRGSVVLHRLLRVALSVHE